jgi:hypothetical protein
VPSERCSIEEQSIEYCGWACCVALCCVVLCLVTSIHNILLAAPQLGIAQKAL